MYYLSEIYNNILLKFECNSSYLFAYTFLFSPKPSNASISTCSQNIQTNASHFATLKKHYYFSRPAITKWQVKCYLICFLSFLWMTVLAQIQHLVMLSEKKIVRLQFEFNVHNTLYIEFLALQRAPRPLRTYIHIIFEPICHLGNIPILQSNTSGPQTEKYIISRIKWDECGGPPCSEFSKC